MDAVKLHSKAEGTAYTLLLIIATRADEEKFSCHPSRELLCKESRIKCERTLIRQLKTLEDLGELTLQRGSGRGNLTSYTINLPGKKGDTQMSPFSENVSEMEKGDKLSIKDDSMVSPFNSAERVTNSAERVTSEVIKGDKLTCAYIDIEPSGNQKESKERETRAKQNGTKAELSPLSLALCEICKLNPDLLSPIRYSDLIATEKKLSANQRAPDEVREFGRRWFANDWRGQKGDAPSLTLVLDEWERVMTANGPVNHLGETWEQEKARRIREEKQREAVAVNGRNGWKF